MVGGPYLYSYSDSAEKTFTPPPHFQIGIYVDFYKIDKWNGQNFLITLDSTIISKLPFTLTGDTQYVRGLCGNCYNEDFKDLYVVAVHSSKTATIKFSTELTSLDTEAFWGFNNFQVSIFQCFPTCLTCTNELISSCKTCYTHATKTLSNYCECDGGYFMLAYANPCIATPCSTCSPCNAACKACSAGTETSCLSCYDGKYLSGTQCLVCDFICKTCITSSTKCTACETGTYLLNNDCKTTCPDGYYSKTPDDICEFCESSCTKCSAGTSSDCTECPDGTYLSSGKCLTCSICKTCKDSASNCLSCNSPNFLTNSQCLTNCPDGTWPKISDNTCKVCNSSCKTCSAGTSADCTSCAGSAYLLNKECLRNCPDSYYASFSKNTCEICNTACITCDGEFASDCLSCLSGKVLNTGRCLFCDTSCITCDGTGATNCLSCGINLYLQEKTCVSDCKTGYYMTETPVKQCIKCSTTCLTCVSANFNDCLTCANNCYFTVINAAKKIGSCTYLLCPLNMIMNPENFTCVEKCDSNKYFDSQNNRCKTCNSVCLTCSGGTSKNCLSCIEGFLSGNSCVKSCPISYYIEEETKKCEECSLNCASCRNSMNCNICHQGFFLNLLNNACMNSSNDGEFINYTDNTIAKCADGCAVCNVFPKCKICEKTFYLNSQSICVEPKKIQPILLADEKINNLFHLTFNDTWTNFFNNLTSNSSSYNITIENLLISIYKISFTYDFLNSSPKWEIMIDFTNDSPETSKLIINFFPIIESSINLTQKQVTADVEPYVLKNANKTKSGESLIFVTPSLSYLSDKNQKLNLSLSANFSDFFEIMPKITSIKIKNLENKFFNYTLNKTNITSQFTISLNFSKTVLGRPLLTIFFDIPGSIILHATHRLSRKNVSLNLFDSYIFDQSTKTHMELMDYTMKLFSYFLGPLAFVYGMIGFGSLSFHGLEAVNIIKFLRYIQLDYPPQALIVFKSNYCEWNIFNFLDDFNNDDNLPSSFQKYGIHSNFFSTGNEKLMKLLIVFGLALIFQSLSIKFKNRKVILVKILNSLAIYFYWNIFLMVYMAYLMDLCFYCYVNMKYYLFDSLIEIGSFQFSIIFIIITSVVHFFLYRMILGKKPNKIQPLEKNKTIKTNKNANKKNEISFQKLAIELKDSAQKDSPRSDDNTFMSSHPKSEKLRRKTWWDEKTAYDQSIEENSHKSPQTIIQNSIKLNKFEEDVVLEKEEKHKLKPKEKVKKYKYEVENQKILILMIDFQQHSKTQKFFVMFLMMRYIILPCIVILFQDNTLSLIGNYFSFNLMFLIYILCMQPFTTWWLFFHYILIEVGIMVAIAGALLNYMSQIKEKFDYDDVMLHGWLIYYGNFFVIIVLIWVYIWEILSAVIHKIISLCKKKHNKIHAG